MVMTIIARRHEQVPDASVLSQLLLVFDDLDDFPAITFSILSLVSVHVRADMRFNEVAHPVAPIGLPFSWFEIHGCVPSSLDIVVFGL